MNNTSRDPMLSESLRIRKKIIVDSGLLLFFLILSICVLFLFPFQCGKRKRTQKNFIESSKTCLAEFQDAKRVTSGTSASTAGMMIPTTSLQIAQHSRQQQQHQSSAEQLAARSAMLSTTAACAAKKIPRTVQWTAPRCISRLEGAPRQAHRSLHQC
jgi:hypothetical protein